jgi:predicted alternative tryptophan synthase beta-subunit
MLLGELGASVPACVIAVEPASCPSLTRGQYAFDYGDTAATPALALSQQDKRGASVMAYEADHYD